MGGGGGVSFFYYFLKVLMVSDKQFTGLLEFIQLYKQNPLDFFFFTIYQKFKTMYWLSENKSIASIYSWILPSCSTLVGHAGIQCNSCTCSIAYSSFSCRKILNTFLDNFPVHFHNCILNKNAILAYFCYSGTSL